MTQLRDGRPRHRRAAATTAAALAVSMGALVTGAAPAGAAGPVDQQQTVIDFPIAPPSVPPVAAQTFTSAVAGLLDQVDIAIERSSGDTSGIFTVEIQTLAGGAPSGTVVTSGTVAASAVTVSSGGDDANMPLVAVPLTPVQISAGQSFAIVISHPTDEWFTSLAFNDHYTGGELLLDNGLGGWASISPDTDMAFRTHVSALGLPPDQVGKNGILSGLLAALEQLLPPLAPITNPLADLLRSLRL